jgi:hypothetical protein
VSGIKNQRSNCCDSGAGSSCCGSPRAATGVAGTEINHKRLDIELLYLDLDVCNRCQGTEDSLYKVLLEVEHVLEATGVEVSIVKRHVETEEQAREWRFVSSPTIRLNGRDIQLQAKESLCESCGDLVGEPVDCRVWVYQGHEYTIPPKGLIIEAILKEVYGGAEPVAEAPLAGDDIPENLKRFFAAKRMGGSTCCG